MKCPECGEELDEEDQLDECPFCGEGTGEYNWQCSYCETLIDWEGYE